MLSHWKITGQLKENLEFSELQLVFKYGFQLIDGYGFIKKYPYEGGLLDQPYDLMTLIMMLANVIRQKVKKGV